MQILKCVVVCAVITAAGISKAHASYVPTPYVSAPVPDTVTNASDKGKTSVAVKKNNRTESRQAIFTPCRLLPPVQANGEPIAWEFRARMLLN